MSLTSENGPALTMPVAPAYGGGYGNMGGFGDGGWWGILFLIALFCGGWGGFGGMGMMGMWPWMFGGFGGWGGNGCNGNAATQSDVQRGFDQQTLISKIDQQTYGLAQSTYDVNNTLQNGFSSAELSRCNQQAALMQMLYQMSSQQAQCCCGTREAISGVNYNLSTQSGDTRNTIQTSTRDIIDNQNANTRAILDKMCQQEIAAKDAQIASQNQQIFALQLASSQGQQTAQIEARADARLGQALNAINPPAVPSYQVPNPYTGRYGYGYNGGYGFGGGCGGCCNG